MLIHSNHIQDLRRYKAPMSSDVAALIIGDGHNIEPLNRDILLNQQQEGL